MSIAQGLLLSIAVAGIASVGFAIGAWLGRAARPKGDRWLDLYDVFDEEDQDAIG